MKIIRKLILSAGAVAALTSGRIYFPTSSQPSTPYDPSVKFALRTEGTTNNVASNTTITDSTIQKETTNFVDFDAVPPMVDVLTPVVQINFYQNLNFVLPTVKYNPEFNGSMTKNIDDYGPRADFNMILFQAPEQKMSASVDEEEKGIPLTTLVSYLEQAYRDFITQPQFISFTAGKDSSGKWYFDNEAYSETTITFTIGKFTHSKAALEKEASPLSEGFFNALDEDINAALDNLALPEGLDKDKVTSYVQVMLTKKFFQEFAKQIHSEK